MCMLGESSTVELNRSLRANSLVQPSLSGLKERIATQLYVFLLSCPHFLEVGWK